MAIAQPAPAGEPLPNDLVTYEEAVEMFRECPYPTSVSTLKRLVRAARHRVTTYRRPGSKAAWVSYTDLMELHRDWAAGQEPSDPAC
ncbi:hypothetical protein [Streptomyces sp. NPDC046862]|uniref:hypothetical protein n=1 Tax=Streptomyces sp. NPDC046862 TaxID=3154603 RepID=UPI00345402C2